MNVSELESDFEETTELEEAFEGEPTADDSELNWLEDDELTTSEELATSELDDNTEDGATEKVTETDEETPDELKTEELEEIKDEETVGDETPEIEGAIDEEALRLDETVDDLENSIEEDGLVELEEDIREELEPLDNDSKTLEEDNTLEKDKAEELDDTSLE